MNTYNPSTPLWEYIQGVCAMKRLIGNTAYTESRINEGIQARPACMEARRLLSTTGEMAALYDLSIELYTGLTTDMERKDTDETFHQTGDSS